MTRAEGATHTTMPPAAGVGTPRCRHPGTRWDPSRANPQVTCAAALCSGRGHRGAGAAGPSALDVANPGHVGRQGAWGRPGQPPRSRGPGLGLGQGSPELLRAQPGTPMGTRPHRGTCDPGEAEAGGGARSPGRWGRSGRRRRGTPRGSSPRRSPARRPGRRRPNLERGAAREPRRPGQQDGGPERGVCPEAFPRGAAAGPARPQALGRAGRCRQRLAAGLLGQGHGRGRTRGGG